MCIDLDFTLLNGENMGCFVFLYVRLAASERASERASYCRTSVYSPKFCGGYAIYQWRERHKHSCAICACVEGIAGKFDVCVFAIVIRWVTWKILFIFYFFAVVAVRMEVRLPKYHHLEILKIPFHGRQGPRILGATSMDAQHI